MKFQSNFIPGNHESGTPYSGLQEKVTCQGSSLRFAQIAMSALLLCILAGCQGKPEEKEQVVEKQDAKADKFLLKREISAESNLKIEKFCGDCHLMPNPDHFPIDGWRHEVERGFAFYDQSGRSDLVRPNLYDTIAYFTQKAPARQDFLSQMESIASANPEDKVFGLLELPPHRAVNAIGNVEFFDGEQKGLIACDMQDGNIYFHPLNELDSPRSLAKGKAPVNSTICDLDGDGKLDILVSDIGSYKATDSKMGAIIWLQGTEDGFERIDLAKDLGRICQTVVEDFNGDGNNDILVAEFGYFNSGSIYVLFNDGKGFTAGNFSSSEIDNRHGTVRLAAEDLDGDQDIDFMAAIAQEYETVTLFLNDGKGKFSARPLFEAGYPSWGTSGIDLVDLDQDGDKDVLYTNGDTFDSLMPKSYHSIQWLENQGELKFKRHAIAKMPGVHAARSADFDGDGDLDIVACAFMSGLKEDIQFDSLIYLENVGKLKYEKRWIERAPLAYPSLKVADINQDGRPDFAAGTCNLMESNSKAMPLKIYLNQGKSEVKAD